jgi:uncharacterized protein YuzE
MSVTIGGITFDRVDYDREGDVLYLDVGDPGAVADFDESPEGHGLRFDGGGRLVGLTMVNVRWMMERGERITVTVPVTVTMPVAEPLDSAELAAVIDAA